MKKIHHILAAAASLLALAACNPLELVRPEIPDLPAQTRKVPIEFQIAVPHDGTPGTKAMADTPQIKNVVLVVFGGSGYFNEWVPAQATTEMATENEIVYSLKAKLSMSESRLRVHVIANCPSDLIENPPITGDSSQDLEESVMSRVLSSLGDKDGDGNNIEDGYWQKFYVPYGIAAEIDPNGNGDNAYMLDLDGNLIPTTLTVNQFKMVSPIPLVRNFARIKLVNNTSDVTVSHIGVAYAPAKGVIAPILPTRYKVDEWGARVVEQSSDGYQDDDGWHDGAVTVYPVKADKTYGASLPAQNEGESDADYNARIAPYLQPDGVGIHVLGHELKDADGNDVLLAATTGSVYDESFVTNYQNLPMAASGETADYEDSWWYRRLTESPYNYGGTAPGTLTFAPNPTSKADGTPDTGFQEYKAGDYIYVYERPRPRTFSGQTEKATRLVIRAKKGSEPYKYYALDILDEDGNNAPLLRNFTYTVNLASIAAGAGETDAATAADATGANVSADPRTQDLNEVSDGTSSIVVSYVDTTALKAGTYSVMYKFIPSISNGSQHNESVTLEVGYDGTSAGFVAETVSGNGATFAGTTSPWAPFVSIEMDGENPKLYVQDGNNWRVATTEAEMQTAWSKIIYTTVGNAGEAFSYNSNGTIRVTGLRSNGKIYRDVRVNIIQKKTMQVECADKYVRSVTGSSEDLIIRIPDDLTRSMFPMQFKIESAAGSIMPRDGDNLPVQSGASIVPDKNSEPSYYFVKTLTRQDYEDLPAEGGWKTLTCKFQTTRDDSETTIYVSNEYFNEGSDNFWNYEQRYFTNLAFSSVSTKADDPDPEKVYFSFEMDAAHAGTVRWDNETVSAATDKVLPRQVTVRLNNLIPQEGANEGLVRKQGAAAGYYIYNVSQKSNTSPELALVVGDPGQDYSVTLSTDDLEIPAATPEFIPNDKLYKTLTTGILGVDAINMSPSSVALRSGTSQTLTATLTGANLEGYNVTWTSSNESVATVSASSVSIDENGKATITVTGVAVGTATITASCGGKTASCVVTVTKTATFTNSNFTTSNTSSTQDHLKATISSISSVSSSRIESSQSNTITLTNDGTAAASGLKIYGVTITYYSSTYNGVYSPASVTSNPTGGSLSGDTYTWSGETGTLTITQTKKSNQNIRILSIEVEYMY